MSACDQARGGNHGSQSPLEDDQARARRGRVDKADKSDPMASQATSRCCPEPSDAIGWRRRSRYDLWISASGDPPGWVSGRRLFSAA